MPEITHCRTCNARIMFVRYGKTQNIGPIDAEPAENGNIALVEGLAYVDTGDMFEQLPPGPRHLNHYATCPDAKRWRERQAKKADA